MNNNEFAKALLSRDKFLILTHKNPDGDTVCSACALCSALRRKGKTAWLYRNTQIEKKLMPYAEPLFAPEGYEPGCVLSVDIATEGLFPLGFEGGVELCVDHHPTNSHFAKNELIKPERSACGEIVLDLIKALCGKPNKAEATLLYIALTTDTGCFQYANVNAHSFSAASELLRCGADNRMVSLVFFRKVSAARIKLEGLIYSSMEYYRDGKLTVATVTREMLEKAGATEDDCSDLAGLPGRGEDSIVSVLIKETQDGKSKISVRSNPEVSSSDICAVFGGGGHDMAAGCTISTPPDRAKEMLLAVIDEIWK